MALSANKKIVRKAQPAVTKLQCVDGLLHIYKGALLNYEASNIGYVMPATNTNGQEFAGIALEELSVSAADNSADGTYEIEVLPRGCGEEVLIDFGETIANEGDGVYAISDDTVKLTASSVNTTGGMVGIIRQFVSTTKAWVQMVQHPTV
jgi:hypothetical protein